MTAVDLIKLEKEAYDNLFCKKEVYELFINDFFPYPQSGFNALRHLIEKDRNIIFLSCQINPFKIYGLLNIFNIDILSRRCNISIIWKNDFVVLQNTIDEIIRKLFNSYRLRKISAYVCDYDLIIKKKLTELNFHFEAKIFKYGWKNGGYYDVEIFSLFL